MTGQDPNRTGDYEDLINALVDGVLDPAATAELKSRAAGDSRLAQAIIEAWQLQRGLDGLQPERAPYSLSRRLRRIPRQQRAASPGPIFGWPRQAVVAAAWVMVLVAGAVLITRPVSLPQVEPQQAANPRGNDPVQVEQARVEQARVEQARVEQARRDLAVAFHYLDKAGFRVSQRINAVLHEEVAEPVKDSLNKHMPYTGLPRKEKHA